MSNKDSHTNTMQNGPNYYQAKMVKQVPGEKMVKLVSEENGQTGVRGKGPYLS